MPQDPNKLPDQLQEGTMQNPESGKEVPAVPQTASGIPSVPDMSDEAYNAFLNQEYARRKKEEKERLQRFEQEAQSWFARQEEENARTEAAGEQNVKKEVPAPEEEELVPMAGKSAAAEEKPAPVYQHTKDLFGDDQFDEDFEDDDEPLKLSPESEKALAQGPLLTAVEKHPLPQGGSFTEQVENDQFDEDFEDDDEPLQISPESAKMLETKEQLRSLQNMHKEPVLIGAELKKFGQQLETLRPEPNTPEAALFDDIIFGAAEARNQFRGVALLNNEVQANRAANLHNMVLRSVDAYLDQLRKSQNLPQDAELKGRTLQEQQRLDAVMNLRSYAEKAALYAEVQRDAYHKNPSLADRKTPVYTIDLPMLSRDNLKWDLPFETKADTNKKVLGINKSVREMTEDALKNLVTLDAEVETRRSELLEKLNKIENDALQEMELNKDNRYRTEESAEEFLRSDERIAAEQELAELEKTIAEEQNETLENATNRKDKNGRSFNTIDRLMDAYENQFPGIVPTLTEQMTRRPKVIANRILKDYELSFREEAGPIRIEKLVPGVDLNPQPQYQPDPRLATVNAGKVTEEKRQSELKNSTHWDVEVGADDIASMQDMIRSTMEDSPAIPKTRAGELYRKMLTVLEDQPQVDPDGDLPQGTTLEKLVRNVNHMAYAVNLYLHTMRRELAIPAGEPLTAEAGRTPEEQQMLENALGVQHTNKQLLQILMPMAHSNLFKDDLENITGYGLENEKPVRVNYADMPDNELADLTKNEIDTLKNTYRPDDTFESLRGLGMTLQVLQTDPQAPDAAGFGDLIYAVAEARNQMRAVVGDIVKTEEGAKLVLDQLDSISKAADKYLDDMRQQLGMDKDAPMDPEKGRTLLEQQHIAMAMSMKDTVTQLGAPAKNLQSIYRVTQEKEAPAHRFAMAIPPLDKRDVQFEKEGNYEISLDGGKVFAYEAMSMMAADVLFEGIHLRPLQEKLTALEQKLADAPNAKPDSALAEEKKALTELLKASTDPKLTPAEKMNLMQDKSSPANGKMDAINGYFINHHPAAAALWARAEKNPEFIKQQIRTAYEKSYGVKLPAPVKQEPEKQNEKPQVTVPQTSGSKENLNAQPKYEKHFPDLNLDTVEVPKQKYPDLNLDTVEVPKQKYPDLNLDTVEVPKQKYPDLNLDTVEVTEKAGSPLEQFRDKALDVLTKEFVIKPTVEKAGAALKQESLEKLQNPKVLEGLKQKMAECKVFQSVMEHYDTMPAEELSKLQGKELEQQLKFQFDLERQQMQSHSQTVKVGQQSPTLTQNKQIEQIVKH